MRICLIAPGIMPIPPNQWGAVEMMLWDYYQILLPDHYVEIINTPDRSEIISRVNDGCFDAVHLHYDVFIDIIDSLQCKTKIVSSHYPYISQPSRYSHDGYDKIINQLINNSNFHIFASSQNDIETFVSFGAYRERTYLSKLGIKSDSYAYSDQPDYDRTLCFSQIVDRKRQYLIQDIPDIDFFGRLDDRRFRSKTYKGEAPREFLNSIITRYSNFVLLSSCENTTPLVIKEALVCGLGAVVTKPVAVELDTTLDFITVIPEEKVNDIEFVTNSLKENREISRQKRNEIRQYALDQFDLKNILKSYTNKLESLI